MESSHNTPETEPLANRGLPILAIVILAITATAFLLISYYIFVNKCYFSWQQVDPFRRFSFRQTMPTPSTSHSSPLWQKQGLAESIISELPTLRYGKSGHGILRCVVCLTEFQEHDLLRVLPKCNHAFHLDCIDLWLQNSTNCPLCRSAISGRNRYSVPSSSPQDPGPMISSINNGDEEDFVVIERTDGTFTNRQHERGGSNRFEPQSVSHSSRKSKQNFEKSEPRLFRQVSISIMRGEDDRFPVQPIRRSFSMDSVVDRHIYSSVREVSRQNRDTSQVRSNESSSRRLRSIFSFRYRRGSRNAVLPIEF